MVSKHIPEHDRPLVTFALFAYNQEKFIREAVEGAFAQTYEPLEIILSDDCSTDRTFEIMQEMAAAYEGPHRVIIRRNSENLGLMLHLQTVVELASGDFIVLAAGDDISFSNRVAAVCAVVEKDPETMAVFSEYEEFFEEEVPKIENSVQKASIKSYSLFEMLMNGGGVGIGATYAYDKKCFTWPDNLPVDIVSEDRILPLRAAFLGRVYKIEAPLIHYRQVAGSVGEVHGDRGMLGYNHPDHWQIVSKTISSALKDGIGGRSRAILLKVAISLRKLTHSSSRMNAEKAGVVEKSVRAILFIPLRLIRRIQKRHVFVIYIDKEVHNSIVREVCD